jgi:hypothetical protein
MPALAIFLAGGLAVVVATGALLDKFNVSRRRRVLVWWGLFLSPPFLLFFLLVLFRLLFGPFKWPC